VAEHNGALPDLQTIVRLLGGHRNDDQVRCPGPGHSAADRSLSIKLDPNAPDGFLTHSFSGDDPIACRDYVRSKLGLPAFKPNGGRPRFTNAEIQHAVIMATAESVAAKSKPSAVYDYKDRDGTLLYQVLRYPPKPNKPKPIGVRRPDGNGGWIYNLKGFDRRVLYRWPELLQFPDATIFFTEGEKDADRVWSFDLCATTIAFGSWSTEAIEALHVRDVIILQDNDEAGLKRAHEAATRLHGVANSVRVVLLPGLPDRGDVSDWLDTGHTKDGFERICFDTPPWEPAETQPEPDFNTGTTSTTTVEVSNRPKTALPLPFINIAAWDNEPVPQQEWTVHNRFPVRQAVLFSGEGAAGKSTIYLHLCGAHVLGKDWLGGLPEPGPALFIEAEDDAKVMHRRLAAVANHFGTTFGELAREGLHLISLAGHDAVIAATTRSGKIEPTPLYNQLLEAAGDIKPRMIGIASSANVYAGNEIDRSQVQQFISLLTRLAMLANGTCHLISHPSLSGINTDTGLSGNTQWHNAVRARCYLKSAKPEAGEQPDNDLRELVFKKNNYGPVSETIVLRYRDGLFLPLPGVGSLDKIAQEAKADEVFLDLLRRFTREGRNVSYMPGPTYAPALFAKEDEAKKATTGSKTLEAAMRRLFAAQKIHNDKYGKPSNPHTRLVVKGD
jgi:RecA-family ATPase